MHILQPETVAFFGYLFSLVFPPFMAAMLFTMGTTKRPTASFSLALSVVMLLLWVPILMAAPQIIISQVYPAH